MTNLFEKDPYLKEFESKIINVNQELKTIELENTAFYAKGGGQPGDTGIIEIDGESAYNISRDDVFKKLRGKKGTKVDLKIGRSGTENFDIVIIRDDIPLYSVRASTMLNDEVGYTWLTRFSNKSGQEVRKAVEDLLDLSLIHI